MLMFIYGIKIERTGTINNSKQNRVLKILHEMTIARAVLWLSFFI